MPIYDLRKFRPLRKCSSPPTLAYQKSVPCTDFRPRVSLASAFGKRSEKRPFNTESTIFKAVQFLNESLFFEISSMLDRKRFVCYYKNAKKGDEVT